MFKVGFPPSPLNDDSLPSSGAVLTPESDDIVICMIYAYSCLPAFRPGVLHIAGICLMPWTGATDPTNTNFVLVPTPGFHQRNQVPNIPFPFM